MNREKRYLPLYKTLQMEIVGSDLENYLNSTWMVLVLRMETPQRESDKIIRFRNTDQIDVKLTSFFEYRVDL